MECAEIRRRFIEHYRQRGFQLLPRAPMLHPSIPMSFVMSAGLVQVETSLAATKHAAGNKFVLVQDCFRHFDLERVGTDNTHLSLFEMPAAFVFGENARQTVLPRIWDFVTNEVGIDPARIWISYFAGGDVEGHQMPQDALTYQTWRGLGVHDSRLVGLGRPHNYWVQGGGIEHDDGSGLKKCGANTELFYDMGAEQACGEDCQPGCGCGRFIEFSNSLFVSHHLNPQTNTLTPMDDPFTETVIGNERVAMIAQGAASVFDTAQYRPMIEAIRQSVTRADLPEALIQESICVIVDHVRALYVLIADGAPPPGKDGRARLIKLLIRRIVARQMLLGIETDTLLHDILETAVEKAASHKNMTFTIITDYFTYEAARFKITVERGKRELMRLVQNNAGQPLSLPQMHYLEKKHGLPSLLARFFSQGKNLIVHDDEMKS